MATVQDNLQTLSDIKQSIKQALINQGQSVSESDSFASYAGKVNNIQDLDGTIIHLDKTIPYTANVNTSRIQAYTEKITGLDVSDETNLSYYFASMYGLKECNSLNTDNATNMAHMFHTCVTLPNQIQLSDTSKVTNMVSMFEECRNLKSINIDASAITTGERMFYDCISLENVNINISNKITNMHYMFYKCTNLETITSTQFDTSNVTNMAELFDGNTALKSIPNLSINKVTDLSYAFQNCVELEEITITETSVVTKVINLFYNCKKLKRINGILNLEKVTNINFLKNIFGGDASTYAPTLLEEIRIKNLRLTLNFTYLINLSHDSLVYLLNNLYDYSSGSTHTLTLGATNLAKLTEDEIAVGTTKGWTIK